MAEGAYKLGFGPLGTLRRLSARMFGRRPFDIHLDRPVVSFTFDDFPMSAATIGRDLLEARGWRGTYFASASYLGTETHLGRMYDRGTLHSLYRGGHEIGCHTYAHVDAARTATPALLEEIARNTAALSPMLDGARPVTFAFPYGEASPRAKAALADRFQALRGTRPGINRADTDRLLLRSVGIDGGEAGIERAVAYAVDAAHAPGWLIYYAHDIREAPSPWGCTPGDFRRVAEAVAATGAEVLPLCEVLARLDRPVAAAA